LSTIHGLLLSFLLRFKGSEVQRSEVLVSDLWLLTSDFWFHGSMLAKLIEFIGLAELIISTNQPFNPINHQSLTFVFWILGSRFRVLGSEVLVSGF
jgi:hypothetical protein